MRGKQKKKNSHSRKNNLAKLILFLKYQRNRGFSLAEVLVLTFILGIIAALVGPQLRLNDPTDDTISQLKAILQQIRGRAISTTSAIRIKPDPNQPNNKFIVERANTSVCQSLTKLAADYPLPAPATDRDIRVYSTEGFQIGDFIYVGSNSTDNEIVSIPGGSNIITLGAALGGNQSRDTPVGLVPNWQTESSFTVKDLTLPQGAQVSAGNSITDWTLCINSRGIAFIFVNNNNLVSQDNLVLTVSNNVNAFTESITVSRGGAIE